MRNITFNPSITDRSSESIKRYFSDIAPIKLLNREEEHDLIIQAQAGDKAAFDRLVTANLRFVVSLAKKFQNRGLSLDDLIEEGNLGLMEAVQRFDGQCNSRFLTYAFFHICKHIQSAIHQVGRSIRIPSNQQQQLVKIMKLIGRFEQEHMRTPDHFELADMLGMDSDELADLLAVDGQMASFDRPFGNDDDNNTLADVIEGSSERADYAVTKESSTKTIAHILDTLPLRDRTIVKMYFGIGYDFPFSCEEIGLRLNLSCERVRQIKNHALSSLRTGPYRAQLLSCIA